MTKQTQKSGTQAGTQPEATEQLPTDLTRPLAVLSEPERTKPMSLYEAETAFTRLEDLLYRAAEDGSDVTEEQLTIVANEFLEATNATKDAIERYCWLILNRKARGEEREAQATVWENKAKDLKAIAKTDLNLAARLKQRLLEFFDRREITKLDTKTFKLSARPNGGKQPLVVDENCSITDIAQFYPNLVRLEIDKEAVRTFLENGGELPFARLGERGRNLVIKP